MNKPASFAVAGILFVACNASKPQSSSSSAKTAPSKTPDSVIFARYCNVDPGPAPISVTVMRDSAGHIGGYIYKRLILDSPISYLDPKGNEVAMFHVFGSPEEKAKNAPIIDSLRAGYPLEAELACPPPTTAP